MITEEARCISCEPEIMAISAREVPLYTRSERSNFAIDAPKVMAMDNTWAIDNAVVEGCGIIRLNLSIFNVRQSVVYTHGVRLCTI